MQEFFNFFNIEIVSWEESHTFYFIGPAHHTPESFKEICDKHLPEATLKAVAEFNNSSIDDYASLSMVTVIEKLDELLKLEGFTKIKPKTAVYRGSCGRINDEEAIQLGAAADTAKYHSANILHSYDFDEETGSRFP